jgi:hypothetical protein
MVIEINKDIDRYQESVVFGLSKKQLVFSIVSLISGSALVLVLYRYIGIAGSAYVAIPIVAPIALSGFYSYNGMSFYDVMQRKMHLLFANKALTYVSTERETISKEKHKKNVRGNLPRGKRTNKKEKEKNPLCKSKHQRATDNIGRVNVRRKKMVLGSIWLVIFMIAGAMVYKYFC